MRANEFISEKKRRRKKPRWAAYGPGPFGGYGYATGYSGGDGGAAGGDGGVGEGLEEKKFNFIKNFTNYCLKELNIKNPPKVKLVNDTGTTALGYFNSDNHTIIVTVKDRHQMDIMRTLAHEIVHYKQTHYYEPDGNTGSYDENQANAVAGILMRKWGAANPHLFKESVEENFADGKNPQDKGDSQRHGIPKNATLAQLKKIRSSDSASPRKKQLAHWQINMRQGRKT
jgi:hypothetical protein